ncbi:PP0621 family protein [Pandoraea pulmonicola]|uniref:Deaminase n=1 Tax=Pandoraea pulmonicola TaxID=93221 RepID=A0AAJ5D1G9_PANPU|nr:PP0621 family protein [Pandoraea pulmonicola]AJC20055.1 hypothetical protein RO07_05445 [Pandoraea pulmonicola]SUA91669.1 Uncharacterised protein [Pandoraea pulmonicola]
MRNILLLLLLLIGGTWWMRHNERKREAERKRSSSSNDARATAQQSLPPAERMVRCDECQTYLPESESVVGAGGTHFCSGTHRDAYLTREHRV